MLRKKEGRQGYSTEMTFQRDLGRLDLRHCGTAALVPRF